MRRLVTAAALFGAATTLYRLLARGRLTLDLGIGRSTTPPGPRRWTIAAPRELVFEIIVGPVPHLAESFELEEVDGDTVLT